MNQYKISFNEISGRQLLDGVKNIAQFGADYVASFDDNGHENIQSFEELNLEPLNEGKYGCPGVIGYGVQSSLLYGLYPHAFAHRSQNAVWSLYFLTNKPDLRLDDSSEFMMVQPEYNTCEQNYFYPADLFGFYALKLYQLLKKAFEKKGGRFENKFRYIYLNAFTNYIASIHGEDIGCLKWSSENVETHWH